MSVSFLSLGRKKAAPLIGIDLLTALFGRCIWGLVALVATRQWAAEKRPDLAIVDNLSREPSTSSACAPWSGKFCQSITLFG